MAASFSRPLWLVLAAILAGLHLVAWWYSDQVIRVSLAGRAGLLLDALVESAEQTLQASHFLEERIGTRLRSIAAEVASHPEWRDQASLKRVQQVHDLKAIAVYDAQGRLLAASDPDGLDPVLPVAFGCHDLLQGGKVEHTFGFSEGMFCEADAFGLARQLPEGGLVRLLTDVGFVLGFERNVGLPVLLERFRRHPDIEALDLIGQDGRSLLPASGPLRLGAAGPAVSRPLNLHGKPVGVFRLVLQDHGLQALERTATLAILVSALLGFSALGLLRWRVERVEHEREQKRALAEMARQSEGLAHVVAAVAHDIRNPLNTLALGLESVRAAIGEAGPQPGDRLAGRLDLLQKTVTEANRLVQDLLQTTRPILAQPRSLDPSAWVSDLRQAFETGYPGTRLEVVPLPPPALWADPLLLHRLLGNLVGNAAQAGAKRVTLTVAAAAPGFRMSIADDGPGLPPLIQEHLFLPGNTSRPDGSGLGLYNARRLAIAMGGQLTLAATGPGGTRFDLVLPEPPPGAERP